jgi:spermidine synthase
MSHRLTLKGIQVSVFLISTVVITYEILLVKIFAIQYWYHFASLIISVALLGFGASGTVLFLFRKPAGNYASKIFFVVPLLLAVSMWVNMYVWRFIAFNPLMIIWEARETINLIFLILAMFTPFFLGALCIGMGFILFPGHIHKIYCSNLLGSGCGPLLILLTVLHVSPHEIIMLITLLSVAAGFPVMKGRVRMFFVPVMLIAALSFYIFNLDEMSFAMNPYKDFSRAETLQDARLEFREYGPLGLITVIDSPAFHYLPDLSLTCPYPLPDQKGLFLDGNTVGAITAFSGDLKTLQFMQCRTASLAYQILARPDVLIIGGGGGTEILNATYHGAKRITIVEINKDIVRLMQNRYRSFSGNVYNPREHRLLIEDGRGYLEDTDERFDLIQLSVAESMDIASAGVYSLRENYLLTMEALRACLRRLKPGGIISMTQWVKNPPRENLKLLATAIQALTAEGENAPQSVIMIRSWQAATLLVKNGVFSPEDIRKTKQFCRNNLFDLCYYYGITEDETNIVNRMDENYFFHGARKLLSSEKGEFYREYVFDIRPATDNKPFFAHFFKIDMLKKYMSTGERNIIPFIDWGYILVWLSFLVLAVCSTVFILVPIGIIGRWPGSALFTFIYFSSLGLAYMLLEIAFLQQFIRYLYDPVFSATVVISSFLVYSAAGSLIGEKRWRADSYQLWTAVIIIVIVGITYLAADPFLQRLMSGLTFWMRMLLCSILIAPLAVPMGILFPSGLSKVHRVREELIPWAWGINGFFSVMGAAGAVLVAIEYGFRAVILTALTLYIIAGAAYRLLDTGKRSTKQLFNF